MYREEPFSVKDPRTHCDYGNNRYPSRNWHEENAAKFARIKKLMHCDQEDSRQPWRDHSKTKFSRIRKLMLSDVGDVQDSRQRWPAESAAKFSRIRKLMLSPSDEDDFEPSILTDANSTSESVKLVKDVKHENPSSLQPKLLPVIEQLAIARPALQSTANTSLLVKRKEHENKITKDVIVNDRSETRVDGCASNQVPDLLARIDIAEVSDSLESVKLTPKLDASEKTVNVELPICEDESQTISPTPYIIKSASEMQRSTNRTPKNCNVSEGLQESKFGIRLNKFQFPIVPPKLTSKDDVQFQLPQLPYLLQNSFYNYEFRRPCAFTAQWTQWNPGGDILIRN